MPIAAVAGGAGGGGVVLLLVAGAVVFYYCRRHNTNQRVQAQHRTDSQMHNHKSEAAVPVATKPLV